MNRRTFAKMLLGLCAAPAAKSSTLDVSAGLKATQLRQRIRDRVRAGMMRNYNDQMLAHMRQLDETLRQAISAK
jgi:hypothetical protein